MLIRLPAYNREPLKICTCLNRAIEKKGVNSHREIHLQRNHDRLYFVTNALNTQSGAFLDRKKSSDYVRARNVNYGRDYPSSINNNAAFSPSVYLPARASCLLVVTSR